MDRVHKAELKLYAKGLWEVPDRWLNLFVSVSCITVLGRTVGVGGPILIYPMTSTCKVNPQIKTNPIKSSTPYLASCVRSSICRHPPPGESGAISWRICPQRVLLHRVPTSHRLKTLPYILIDVYH